MNLRDLIERRIPPEPWAEGENIPWDELGFSRRMLAEHLSQEHDAASRRLDVVDEQVAWIHDVILFGETVRALDVCCGPGLYASRLGRLGHEVVGIDYSPASIEYAEDEARRDNLSVTYRRQDVRAGGFGDGFGLAFIIFGELNTFRPEDARAVLANIYRALEPGGIILLEVHPREVVKWIGTARASWRAEEAGLFSDRPHLRLDEHFWDEESATATTRYYIVDAATAEVTRHAQTFQGYTDEEYRALLRGVGFDGVDLRPDFPGPQVEAMGELVVYAARKAGPA